MDDASRLSTQLEPLRAALMAAARRDAEARLTEARARTVAIAVDADGAVRGILARAAAEGEAAAERRSAHRLAEAKRQARSQILRAQRAAYDALFDAALAALGGMCQRPEYGALQDRLARIAATVLGGDTPVQRGPEGVVARSDGRYVDLTLPVLVRRCIARMGKKVSRLWQ